MLRAILLGTGTNYIKVIVRLVTGLVTFRLLYGRLGAADFGLYQLLWMSFGFLVLVDFGFGFAVQRATAASADLPPERRSHERGEVVATVFWAGCAIAGVVLVALLLLGGRLLDSFAFADGGDPTTEQRLAALIFAVGMVVAFPFGAFREALRGQHRFHVVNAIDIAASLVQCGAIAWACIAGWSLPALMATSVATSVAPVLAVALVACRDPDLRPWPARFRVARIRELAGFSLFAYGITVTSLLVTQSYQFVIGWVLTVEALKGFVPGMRIAQIYLALAGQLHETTSATAARLGAAEDPGGRLKALGGLLLVSQRWTSLIATPMALPILLDPAGALRLLTGEREPSAAMVQVALLLTVAGWASIMAASCTHKILVVAGYHRALLGFAAIEAGLTVGLAAGLAAAWDSVVGVAVGRAWATAAAVVVLPAWSCARIGVPIGEFLAATGRGLAGSLPAAVVAVAWWTTRPLGGAAGFLAGTALVAAAMPVGWWLLGMPPEERSRVAAAMRRRKA